MIIKETSSMDDIKAVMGDAEILDRLGIDSKKELILPSVNAVYFVGYDNLTPFGVAMFLLRETFVTVHFYVISSKRGHKAAIFAKKVLNAVNYKSLYTNISSCNKDTLRFAEYFGFRYIKDLTVKGKEFVIMKRVEECHS